MKLQLVIAAVLLTGCATVVNFSLDGASVSSMRTDKVWLVLFEVVLITLWIVSRRFGWDERIYERAKDSPITWYWLDVFRIPKTRQNCLRFIRGAWIAMILFSSVATVVVLIWGQ